MQLCSLFSSACLPQMMCCMTTVFWGPSTCSGLAVPGVLTFQPRHSFCMMVAAACSSPNLSGHSSNSSFRILHRPSQLHSMLIEAALQVA